MQPLHEIRLFKTGDRTKSNQIGLENKHSGIYLHVHPSLKVVNEDEEEGEGIDDWSDPNVP